MISHKTRYALRALLFLAEEEGSKPVQLGRIASTQHVPPKYLEIIMLELKKARLVRSLRGPQGGYLLVRPPAEISFGEVVRALEGPLALVSCASVNFYEPCGDCHDEATCAIRRGHRAELRLQPHHPHRLTSIPPRLTERSDGPARPMRAYQFNLPRPEPITDSSRPVLPSMGVGIVLNLQPTGGGKAVGTGDFVLLSDEVDPVLWALRSGDRRDRATQSPWCGTAPAVLRAFLAQRRRAHDRRRAAQGTRFNGGQTKLKSLGDALLGGHSNPQGPPAEGGNIRG